MTQTAEESALVAGADAAQKKAPQKVSVRVLRSYLGSDGKPTVVGAVVDEPLHTARALIAMNKAERVAMSAAEAPLDADGDMPPEEAPKRRGRPPKTTEA